ncbi:unnamed protein product [Caenorhabditis auriculariae]|uniref:Major facilitator superfamily (MFS) profile domain-containing protein n=1 Tax=Caenorhabditis auriculariae TaxID=2777116 RepID=A0A8S1HY65_9PELO|nr:unnamed protein product [Caenorhabditis auriculariae]
MTIPEVMSDPAVRMSVFLVISVALLMTLSPFSVETSFSQVIYLELGMSLEMINYISSVAFLASLLLHFAGSLAIDKIGRRPIVGVAAFFAYSKTVLLIIGLCIVYFDEPSMVSWVAGFASHFVTLLASACSLMTLPTLILSETVPQAAQISVAKITLLLPYVLGTPISTIFPVVFRLFSPGMFILFALAQSPVFYYLYRNLPELKQKSVAENVENIEEEVRSRAATLMCTEKNAAQKPGLSVFLWKLA